MIDFTWIGAEQLQNLPQRFKQRFLELVRTGWFKAGQQFIGMIQREQLSGRTGIVSFGKEGGLNVRTGNLRRSWWTSSNLEGGDVTSIVYTDVRYARIHQYGGTITQNGGRRINIPKRLYVLEEFNNRGRKLYESEVRRAMSGALK